MTQAEAATAAALATRLLQADYARRRKRQAKFARRHGVSGRSCREVAERGLSVGAVDQMLIAGFAVQSNPALMRMCG